MRSEHRWTSFGGTRAVLLLAIMAMLIGACGTSDPGEESANGSAVAPTATAAVAPTVDPAPTPRASTVVDSDDGEDGEDGDGDSDNDSDGDSDSDSDDAGDQSGGQAKLADKSDDQAEDQADDPADGGDDDEGDGDGDGDGERGPAPTTTPPPIPTAAPGATTRPLPTATPAPRSTAVPTATAAPRPTATPVREQAPPPTITCTIGPTTTVRTKQALVFEATADRDVPISYVIDHGDGTRDATNRSEAFYVGPGRYAVTVDWQSANHRGHEACGTVTVLNDDGCWIGLGPADDVGWWCGDEFCPRIHHSLQTCPLELPWGCYRKMTGALQCVPRTHLESECLIGHGPDGSFGWFCGNRWCDPAAPHTGCRSYPIYGCHATVDGGNLCIEPPREPIMSCTISRTQVAVGEVITLRAVQQGLEIAVEVVFHHGDGTVDPRPVAQAYYDRPGNYRVTMDWKWVGGSGTADCGTVVVT